MNCAFNTGRRKQGESEGPAALSRRRKVLRSVCPWEALSGEKLPVTWEGMEHFQLVVNSEGFGESGFEG